MNTDELTKDMENDIKFLLDAVDEFQKKYNGIYISLFHILNERNKIAHAAISNDEETFYTMTKWSNGEYTK